MSTKCFNCNEKVKKEQPICPYCHAVQRNTFTREEFFDYLETQFPTKPIGHKKFTSTKKIVPQLNYAKWLLISIFTFGIGYYFYLLRSLKNLNDHWIYPHGSYEIATKVDLYTSSILIIFTNYLCLPLIQYFRYEKLRRHLEIAPTLCKDTHILIDGKNIYWNNTIFVALFSGTILMLFFGLASITADLYFEFLSIAAIILFFSAAGIIFIFCLFWLIKLIKYEIDWQMKFNKHLEWHKQIIDSLKELE
ncbi:MAG: hypothetical protein JXA54_15335 [Candidatus Heimdallarchaeota archaeon]|nr:hypothetical protein [Candidatus Heimdallarchaeota archaeon]